jgi:hypothetical protein
MNCLACNKTRPLNSCSDEIVIGTFEPNTNYYIYLQIVATGNLTRLEATSENDGLLPIDVTNFDFATTLEYMLWVTLETATNQHDNVSFTATDGTDIVEGVTCLLLNFEKVMDGDRCCLCIGTQTIFLIPIEMEVGENDFIDQTPQGPDTGLLAGLVDGANMLYTVSEAIYKSGTLRVFVNGVLQQNGATWTETTPGSGTFTFAAAPFAGDIITAIYQKP